MVILVNFWSFNPLHVEDRMNKRVGSTHIYSICHITLCSGARNLLDSFCEKWTTETLIITETQNYGGVFLQFLFGCVVLYVILTHL